jgi:hypothetical protein
VGIARPEPVNEAVAAGPSVSGLPLSRWLALPHAACERLLQARHPRLLIVALLVNGVLIGWIANVTLQRFPNSGDEYAYLVSAELFAQGKTHVASPPEPRAFFDVTHVINDGRYYGKYPPGWPAVLAVFVLLGAPWLANLVIGLATLVVIYALARRHFGERTGNATALLSLCCPFFLFNSASLFSHSLCLFCLALATLALFECLRDPAAKRWFLAFGTSLGLACATRPFTAGAMGAVLGVFLLVQLRAQPPRFVRNLLLVAAPGLGALLLLSCLYNRAMTGGWLLQPFVVYDPKDTLGFDHLPAGVGERLRRNVSGRLMLLTTWMPLGTLLFAVNLVARRAAPLRGKEALLIALPGALLLAFFPYWGDGWFQYGPRYLYEALFALLVLAALGLQRLQRWAGVALIVALGLSVRKTVQAHAFYGRQVHERLTLQRLVTEAQLTNAVVFLATGAGSMAPGDLVRNQPPFDGPVVFVREWGPHDLDLLRRYPGRKAYVFRYDLQRRAGTLSPLEIPASRSFTEAIARYRAAFPLEPRFLE